MICRLDIDIQKLKGSETKTNKQKTELLLSPICRPWLSFRGFFMKQFISLIVTSCQAYSHPRTLIKTNKSQINAVCRQCYVRTSQCFLTYSVVDGDVKHAVAQTKVYLPPGVVVISGRVDATAHIVLHWLVSSTRLAVHSHAARARLTDLVTESAADVSGFPICHIHCTQQKTKQLHKA